MTRLLIPSEKQQLLEGSGGNEINNIKKMLESNTFRCEIVTDEKGIAKVTFLRADIKNNKEVTNNQNIKSNKDIANEPNINNEAEKKQYIEGLSAQDNKKIKITSELDIIKYTSKLLRKLGINADIKGYTYINEIMGVFYNNRSSVYCAYKEVYPQIATRYKTTSKNIERNVMYAIEIAFKKENQKAIKEILGFENKPTTKRFLNDLFEYIKFTTIVTYNDVNIQNEVKKETQLDQHTSVLLKKLGITGIFRGYNYIKEAMVIFYKNEKNFHFVTKEVYPEIAKKCKTTTSNVEHNIRHAIEIIFKYGNKNAIKEILGFEEQPTNKKFLNGLFEYIQYNVE